MSVHFEIHVADRARAPAFYYGPLGWTYALMEGGEGNVADLITPRKAN